jgi:hypothetical protein
LDEIAVSTLKQLAEPLVALSLTHLSGTTRQMLAADELSVNAYPSDFGGLIYVGTSPYRLPAEPDLAAIFDVAARAGIVWLKFDSDGAVIDGLPVFDDASDGDSDK